ncbi:uncharacterized protein [Argopecten irradians]|uniref:uncharacterized protein n=1 Tax=Argopecten irradians TaxID=31199 RepID=UPI003719EDA2
MITAEEMAIADRRTERKVFQFISIIKWLSEQSFRKAYVADVSPLSPPLKCYVRGSGLSTGVTGRKARFTFHTTDISKIRDISINIRGPRQDLYCERIVNMLNSNTPLKLSRKGKTKDIQDPTAQQIQDRVSPTEYVHGYLDDGFGNIFLRVKDVDKMVNGTSNANTSSFSCQCHGLGNFLFTFIPVFAGIHTISIKTGTRHIGDSPYKVKIYQPCDLKQKTTNDTNDKLFILNSLSIGSFDENSNTFNKEEESNPQQEIDEKVNLNGNGKSPRKPERLRLKRQFTIRKKRVLRKVVTKNGEEVSVLGESSVPSLSRDASINTDSDLTEDEARGIPSDRRCRDIQSTLGVTKRRLVKGKIKKEVERTYLSKSDTDVPNRQEIQNQKGDMSLSGKLIVNSSNRDKRTTEITSKLGSPNVYKQRNSNHGNSPVHDRSSQCYQDGYKSIQTDLVDGKKSGCESSLSDSRSHFHGNESIPTHANLVPRTVSYESSEIPNSKMTLCNVVCQPSIDSSRFFHNVVQTAYTAPSSPGSELTSSTGEEVTSPRSNFSLFFQGLDEVSSSSLSTFSVKGDDSEITESRDRMEATVDANTQVQQSDVVSENPIERLSEKLDRELCYTESGKGYRSGLMSEISSAVSFRSAFSKPVLYTGETFDCSDLTHEDELSRYNKYTTDKHCDKSCIPGTCSGDGRSGQVRYLQHWIDNQTLPGCDTDREHTTGIAPFDYDKAKPSRLQYTKSSSDSLKGEGIDLPGKEPHVIKQERKTPIPTIGLLGTSTSDAVPPDILKPINGKLHCPEWRDNKPDEIMRRKSDTAISNSSQNTTLMVFHTLPSFESAVCLPSNMNIVVPTPHREKCTQVSADEITETTGSTLRMSYLRLTRRRVCIKINAEGDITSGSGSNDFVDASGHLMQDRLINMKAHTASVDNSHLRITGDDSLFQSLQNLNRRAIRQSTTETVDSGIADENSKPSSVAPSGVAMEKRHTFLSGHKLVHRRPYKGIINLDPKLVRSNSTPDSSFDHDGRFFLSSNSLYNAVESSMPDNLEDFVVSKSRNFRPLRKGQAVSLSDPELHLSGISRFKSKFPCFMKTTQQIEQCNRFLQNSQKANGDGDRIQSSDDSDKEGLPITKEEDKQKNMNVQESVCDNDQVSRSEVGAVNEEIHSNSEKKPGHDIDSCKDIFDSISHDHTMDLAVPSQCNYWDVQRNKNSNKNHLDPFTYCPEPTEEGSCDKINILTNHVDDFSNNDFQGVTANDGISDKRLLQFAFPNDGSPDGRKSDIRNISEKEETADDLFAFLRYDKTANDTTYVQNSLSTEKSSDDNYIGFGINRQDRTDLLHNLKEFQNLQTVSDNVLTEKTSLQLSENDEEFSETTDNYNHINVDNESNQSNTLCFHKDLSGVDVISQSEIIYHHEQVNRADEIDQLETLCHQINDSDNVSQSKTTYHPNRKYRASLYHKIQQVSLYPDKRNVITSLPTHYVTSIYFEVEACAFNCISTHYSLPCKHPFSLEDENNSEPANVDNKCDMSNSRNYEIDLFDMKDEMQSLPCEEAVTDGTNTEPLCVDGLGLTLGQVGIKNNFQIWAASDVTGCPTVSIYGPQPHCVTETCVVYTGDGLYEVVYEVTHPGYYMINVKWRDLEIHESLCRITY